LDAPGDYIVTKQDVNPGLANEALADPDRVVIDPDPASKSGRGVRIIGFSITARAVYRRVSPSPTPTTTHARNPQHRKPRHGIDPY
jgi:hypothetical protein